MSKLHYKASNIARAEQELNANFFQTLEGLGEGAPSFTALLMILQAGGLTQAEADDLLDNEGIEAALSQAVEALGKAGFLAKMNQAEKSNPNQKQPAASQNTGSATKA